MRLKFYLFAVLTMLFSTASAQLETGKVYRIKNAIYGPYVHEDPVTHLLRGDKQDNGNDKYAQMWIAEGENGKFAFQNVYTGRYIEPNGSTVRVYNTVTDNGYRFDILSSTCEGYYDIRSYVSGEWFMSCSYDGKILSWFAGEGSEPTVSEWTFEEVAITQEEIDEARRKYTSDTQFSEDVVLYYTRFRDLFNDDSCTDLKSTYKSMTDEQMLNTMEGFPQVYIDIALKIKNGTWGEYEKEFRTATYKPYSNADNWGSFLKANPYSKLNAPTGITANKGDVLLVFVDKEINSPSSLHLEEVEGNNVFSSASVELKKGLNLITATKGGSLFITYKVDTYRTTDTPVLADYPDVNIHIEGGTLNGYFDKSRHTNEDWVKMQNLILKHDIVNVKGEHAMFHMHRDKVTAICPDNIYESIDWWDTIVMWEKELMGATQYADRWNNMMLCADGEGQYMFATYYYTYYEYSTLKDILPKDRVFASPGFAWGPAHEIGHMNQAAINIVSCTEVSNNLFSNMVTQRMGKTTTRGQKMDVCYNDWENHIPFPKRSEVFSKTRMYWQLYLYFHEAKHDTTFYPRLFEYLRDTPLSGTSGVNAKFNQLRFAEACCEIAQMDLSEFFEVWGFFEPMDNVLVGDYSNYYVTLTEEDAEASRKRMQQYSRKGGHILFIEDRVKPSKRTDGVDGNRLDYNEEVPVGSAGDVGQWGDYIDHSVKAKGYFYTVSSKSVNIQREKSANGAVGFKVYGKEGNLIGVSNTYNIKLMPGHGTDGIRIVAAQADGTDVELKPAYESDDESIQKEFLGSAITEAEKVIGKKTTTGREIGYFYADALTELTALYNDAKVALENMDTSSHSFKEWAALINAEIEKLENDLNARAYFKELDVYRIINAKEKANQLCYSETGLKADKQNQTPITSDNKKWMVESTGEMHHYYIKNKNGHYIDYCSTGETITCYATNNSKAVAFKANYMRDGKIYFTTNNGDYISLGTDFNVICSKELSDAAMWTVIRLEANNTGIEELKTENGKAKTIYDLQGRKVENPTKGMYIINGKKTLIK